MEAEATRLDFIEAATAQLCGVDSWTAIAKQNLQTVGTFENPGRNALAIDFDGLIGPAVITMTDDISKRFVDRAGDGTALGRRKPEDLGEGLERATHDAEQFRIALQFDLQ